MKTLIVTEGDLDKNLLEAVLPTLIDPSRFAIVAAGGRSAAISLSRSYLVSRNTPVLLLVDSETNHTDSVETQRLILNDSLSAVATPDRFRVVLAVPEIEVVFLQDRKALETAIGAKLSDGQWARAEFEPKRVVFTAVAEHTSRALAPAQLQHQLLGRMRLDALGQHPLFQEMVEFINSHASQRHAV